MIVPVGCVILECNRCKEQYTNSSDFSIFADTLAAIDDAQEDEWITVDKDKHYCPDCYESDDDGNNTIKPATQ